MFVMSSWFVVLVKAFFLDNLLSSCSICCLSSDVSNYYSQISYFSLKFRGGFFFFLLFASWAGSTVVRYRVYSCSISQKSLPTNARDARDVGSIPGSGRSSGGGNGNTLQYFCLGNPMDRGAWQATGHGVAKNQTRLKWLSMHICHIVSGMDSLTILSLQNDLFFGLVKILC